MNGTCQKQNRRMAGFTLIELLVVIAIVFILARILLPVAVGARAAGRAVKCVNNLRQLHTAISMYSHDWLGVWPARADSGAADNFGGSMWIGMTNAGGSPAISVGAPAIPKTGALAKYMNNLDGHNDILYLCPETAIAPSSDYLKSVKLSYAMNGSLGNFIGKSTIDNPAGTYLFIEVRAFWCGVYTPNDGSHPAGGGCSSCDKGGDRHHGGGHILFCDGHVVLKTAAAIDNDIACGIGMYPTGPGTTD